MKNIIFIKNLTSPLCAAEVKNFSDENVEVAVAKLVGVKPEDLEHKASSMSGGIYEVKSDSVAVKNMINNIEIAEKYGILAVHVLFGNME